jgi:hypothetical protein
MKKPRVLMADDHSLILAGLRKLVEPAGRIAPQRGGGTHSIDAPQGL